MNYDEFEGISLKELLMLLWKQKNIIIGIVAGTMLITSVFVFVVQRPQYESTSKIIIKIPETTSEKYGNYNFPTANLGAFTGVLDGKNENGVTVSANEVENCIVLKAVADKPEKAKAIVDESTKLYIQTLRIKYKVNAVDVFLNNLESQNILLKESISFNSELIKNLIKIKNDPLLSNQQKKSMANTVTIYVDQNRAGFTEEIQSGVEYIDAKVAILLEGNTEVEQKISYNTKYIDELNKEKLSIGQKLGKTNEGELLNNKADVLKDYISVIQEANLADEPIGTKKMMIIFIGLVLSLFMGCIIVIFRDYWKNT